MPKYIFKRGYLRTHMSIDVTDYFDLDVWDSNKNDFVSVNDFCNEYNCKLFQIYDTLHARETIRLCVFEVIDEKKPGRPKTKLQK